MDRIETLYARIEALDPFSEERDAFATAILGGSVQMPFDGEGRVSLPENLLAEANIDGQCVFVGKGATFEIWEPKAFTAHETQSRQMAKERRLALRAEPAKGGAA
jgi:MraZ protein